MLTERLSLATAVAKVGVWEWDLASNTLTWDATMFDIYGLPPVVPMPYDRWSAAVCPEDLPAVEATLQKSHRREGPGIRGIPHHPAGWLRQECFCGRESGSR